MGATELGDPATLETEFAACCEQGAPESIDVAWAMVFGDAPLADVLKAAAVEKLLAGGAQGIPWQVVMWNVDPREALAEVLEEWAAQLHAVDDELARPCEERAAQLRESVEASMGEPVGEFNGRAYMSTDEMVRAEHRLALRMRRQTPPHQRSDDRRPRGRRARERRHSRAPPAKDGDDEPPDDDDVDPAQGRLQ